MPPKVAAPDFKLLFEQAPGLFLALAPDPPRFTILGATDAYLRATLTERGEVVGRGVFEVFPDNPDDAAATGVGNLRASLERALKQKRADTMAVQKYDIRRPEEEGGGFEERFWSPVNTPVLSPEGKVVCILHRVEDVTGFVRADRQGRAAQARSEELERQAESMRFEVLRRSGELGQANQALREANAKLEQACLAAEAAGRAKAEFLANISHEIRTPLNAVVGFAQLLERDPAVDPAHRAQVHTIHQAGEHLLGLVNDVLDMAKMEAGRMTLAPRPTAPAALLRDTAQVLEPRCREKGLALEVVLSPDLPRAVSADPLRLRQMVLNLLGNAVKFTERGGIRLEAAAAAAADGRTELCIAVEDTGPGIAADELPRLFARFEQAGRRAALGGTGLGLALVRQLARLMDGDVDVVSRPGAGSRFTLRVSVPLLPDAAVEAEPPAQAGPLAQVEEADADRPLLIADDLPANRELLLAALTRMGFRKIAVAQDGAAALEAARKERPALVLMDLFMPGMDGFEAARRIRALPGCQTLPMLAISASVLDHKTMRSRLEVFQGFLPKPFRMEELQAALERHGGFHFTKVQRRVLVVDDQEFNRRIAASALVRAGHAVASCRGGAEAVDRAEQESFDVVLLDLRMPGMDGCEAARRIRAAADAAGSPCPHLVAMSADDSPEDRAACRAAGMDGFLGKPFRIEDLVARVEAAPELGMAEGHRMNGAKVDGVR